MRLDRLAVVATFTLAVAACGDDDQTCDPAAQTGCDVGQVCEQVSGGEPACFAPVVLRGMVFDLADDSAIEGARVVAIDVNGAPVSSVAVTDADGNYSLAVPSTRAADGTPAAVQLTLRADAAGYQTFPSGLRQALPVDTGVAVSQDGAWVVESALTDIGLLALAAGAGDASIYGTVEIPADHGGVLVVAETGGVGASAIADRDGDYRIYNLAPGTYSVKAYAMGVNYVPGEATLAAGEEADVDLALADTAAGTVTGSINIVNPGSGTTTSVILVVESTFVENLARGEMPPGLRAPAPGVAPDVSNAYTIEGVPAGRYVVLGAFENDNLVRDPDLSIGGTSILHIDVAAGATTTVDSFKVTGALDVLSPGVDAPEEVAGNPTFSWKDDSSEDRYQLQVYDAFGELVWETEVAKHTGDDPSVPYAGPALEPAMYYQFRATSIKDGSGPISRTEDLRGVFFTP